MSYDSKCYDLAEHFLPSMASDRLKAGLAQAIQDAVEDYSVGEAVNLTAAILGPVGKPCSHYARPVGKQAGACLNCGLSLSEHA